jgi:hypothetical protein
MTHVVLQEEIAAPLHPSKKTCKDMEESGIADIMVGAVQWWENRRPVGWTLEQHLASPGVNQVTGPETELANSVANYILRRRRDVIK